LVFFAKLSFFQKKAEGFLSYFFLEKEIKTLFDFWRNK